MILSVCEQNRCSVLESSSFLGALVSDIYLSTTSFGLYGCCGEPSLESQTSPRMETCARIARFRILRPFTILWDHLAQSTSYLEIYELVRHTGSVASANREAILICISLATILVPNHQDGSKMRTTALPKESAAVTGLEA